MHINTSSHCTQCSLSWFSRHRCVNVFKLLAGTAITALLHGMTLLSYDYGYRYALCLFAYVKKKKRSDVAATNTCIYCLVRLGDCNSWKKRGRKKKKKSWTRQSARLMSTTQTQSAQPPSILSIPPAIPAVAVSTQYYLVSVARDIEIVVFDGKQRIQFRFSIHFFSSPFFFRIACARQVKRRALVVAYGVPWICKRINSGSNLDFISLQNLLYMRLSRLSNHCSLATPELLPRVSIVSSIRECINSTMCHRLHLLCKS